MFASATPLLTGEGEQTALVPNIIDPDVLWSCTTCGACVNECPVDIEHIDAIVDMRRYQVLMESEFPSEAGLMLRNVENQGDPWAWVRTSVRSGRRPSTSRSPSSPAPSLTTSSTCTGSAARRLDERARKGVQATARMLHRAGVTFGILGPRSPVRVIRCAAWATSTCTRSSRR